MHFEIQKSILRFHLQDSSDSKCLTYILDLIDSILTWITISKSFPRAFLFWFVISKVSFVSVCVVIQKNVLVCGKTVFVRIDSRKNIIY